MKTATIRDAITAQIIITNPGDTRLKNGTNLNKQLKAIEINTTMLTAPDFFIGGINIARNIP